MEDTLRVLFSLVVLHLISVLILVLMEDTLRVKVKGINVVPQEVLILVLMEDTLRVDYVKREILLSLS